MQLLVNGHVCHYQLDGPAEAPLVVLCHALGANLAMWDAQLEALLPTHRVLRYDIRGQGGSQAPDGDYRIEQLGGDVLALLDALRLETFAFCGLSMGGLIGLWLGAHARPRLQRLVICNSAARIGTAEAWNQRIDTVRRDGVAGMADAAMQRWFTPGFRSAEPLVVETVRQQVLGCSPLGYAGNCAAIRDADLRALLGRIDLPTLYIAGRDDATFPVAAAEALAAALPQAQLAVIDGAHLANVESPAAFNRALLDFLN